MINLNTRKELNYIFCSDSYDLLVLSGMKYLGNKYVFENMKKNYNYLPVLALFALKWSSNTTRRTPNDV